MDRPTLTIDRTAEVRRIELDATSWIDVVEGFVVDAEPGDPWGDAERDLWRSVLERQGGRIALFARFPEDPSHN